MATRKQGTVKWFNADKGFGFISQEAGEDLFVHYSEISASGYRSLDEGMKVEFEVTQGKKGKQASKVTPVKNIPDAPAPSSEPDNLTVSDEPANVTTPDNIVTPNSL